ncbi:MAG: carbonic anhydrase [Chloroflexi bacterium]|nr:carbonic anhydrase [Chloroflexota bacterium]
MNSDRGEASGEYARILSENERYTEVFNRAALGAAPMTGIAIVACMDARLDIEEALGLRTGDAHVIRNAGGLASDDAIRSLIISQRLLGTDEILVIAHTGCGLLDADVDALRRRLASESGVTVDLEFGAFSDLEAHIRTQVDRLRSHPWLRHVPVHGLLFEVETGRLHEIV